MELGNAFFLAHPKNGFERDETEVEHYEPYELADYPAQQSDLLFIPVDNSARSAQVNRPGLLGPYPRNVPTVAAEIAAERARQELRRGDLLPIGKPEATTAPRVLQPQGE